MCDVSAAALAVTAATTAAGAAASATNKPKAQTATTTTNSEPWENQKPFIQQTMADAQSNYQAQGVRGAYQGDTSADMNDLTKAGLDQTVDYANGQGGALASQASDAAGTMLGAAPGFVDRATNIATNGAGPANATASGVLTQAANGQPMTGPTAAGTAGLDGQTGALSTAQGLVQQAQGDPAQRALTTAQGYANDPTVDAQIDAAARDVARNFSEVTMPGLNARASAGGNVNSARAGAAEAVAARGAQDRIADTSAAIRGNAFNTGVQASLTGNAQNNALALGANDQAAGISGALSGLGESQRQFDTSTRLGAAETLGQQDTANRALDVNAKLEANAQTGQAALSGFDAAQSAGVLADANAGRSIGAGLAYQTEAQRAAAEEEERYYREYQFRNGITNDYAALVANKSFGESKSSATTTPAAAGPGIIQGALGGATLGMGLYSGMNRAPSVGGNPKYV